MCYPHNTFLDLCNSSHPTQPHSKLLISLTTGSSENVQNKRRVYTVSCGFGLKNKTKIVICNNIIFCSYLEGPSGLDSSVNDSEERPENSTRGQLRRGLESKGISIGCQTSEALTRRRSECSQKKECKDSESFSDFLNVPKWAVGNIKLPLYSL